MQVREKLGIAAELRAAPTPTIHKRTRARRKQLIDHLESVDEVTTSDVANLLGIGRTNASQFLSTMLRDGKIRQVGYGRYALPYSRVKITQPDPPPGSKISRLHRYVTEASQRICLATPRARHSYTRLCSHAGGVG